MTPQEALSCFGLSRPGRLEQIHGKYAQLLREWNLRLNNASSIEKRKEAQEKLGELKEAKLLLEGMAQKSTGTPASKTWAPIPQRAPQPVPIPTFAPRTQSQRTTARRRSSQNTTRAAKTKANSDLPVILIAIIVLLLIMSFARTTQPKSAHKPKSTQNLGQTYSIKMKPPKSAEPSTGRLVVKTYPWSKVFVGSRFFTNAPSLKECKLPVGKYRVRLVFQKGHSALIPVQIKPGKRTVLKYNLYTRKLKIEGS